MKIFFVVFFYIALLGSAHAQTPDWVWQNSFGGHGDDLPGSIITDPEGNIYMTGVFSDTATFGNYNIPENYRPGYQAGNGYFCKISSDGNVLWVKHSDGGAYPNGPGFYSLNYYNHYIYALVYFYDSMKFEDRTIYNKNGPRGNALFAKFSTDGDLLWIKTIADSNSDNPLDASISTIDSSGHLILTGLYSGKVNIQGKTLQTPNILTFNFFLARFDTIGNLEWIRTADRYNADYSGGGNYGICTDNSNNIYVLGEFHDTLSFGGEFFLYTTKGADSIKEGDFFVAKFDSAGDFLWAFNPKSKHGAHGSSICCKGDGIFTILGDFWDTIDLGNKIKISAPYPSRGALFLAQFDPTGKPRWAYNSTGTPDFISGSDLRCDNEGNLYLAATFSGTQVFWNDTIINGYPTLITAKLSKAGSFQWLKSSWEVNDGVSGSPRNFSIAVDDNNHAVYCAGSFDREYKFDDGYFLTPLPAWDQSHISSGVPTSDIFLAKINDPPLSVKTESKNLLGLQTYPNPTSGIFHCQLDGMYVDPSGSLTAAMYDILGRQVMDLTNLARNNNNGVTSIFTVDASKVVPGVYTIRYRLGSLSYAKQFVIAH